jgi:drug/metabolite transporter (DMT)-like permease
VIYAVALAAALCLGLGFVLQQHAAHRAPPSDFLRFRLLVDLIKKPVWLAGIAAMVVGQLLSATALTKADVSLVEPMLTANLLFALVFARLIYHQPLGIREWLGALLLSGGVAAFLVGGQPYGGNPDGDSLPRWMLAMAIAALAWICVAAARRQVGPPRAMLLATGAGLLFGIQDGLTRRATHIYDGTAGSVVLGWAPYALVAIGIVGILLAQSAFEAGSLQASLPALTASEPLAGIAVGIVVFSERLSLNPGALGLEAFGLAAMVVGVLLVGTGATFGRMETRRALARARAAHHAHLPTHLGHGTVQTGRTSAAKNQATGGRP